MSPGELALAFLLLTAPPGPEEPAPADDAWPAIQSAVHTLAMDWEILDKNETKFLFARADEFGKDLNILRKRYHELKDAPKISEVQRFPERQTVADHIKFNRAYRKSLETRQLLETDVAHELTHAIQETDRLYRVWDSLRDARCEYYYISVRRQALKALKEQLGAEAFAMAELPPNVPTWLFAAGR
jgi:hypothetical protein